MADWLAIVLIVGTVVASVAWEQHLMIRCHWCGVKHRGRCIYNPRAGRLFANTNDGYFDYDDPNK